MRLKKEIDQQLIDLCLGRVEVPVTRHLPHRSHRAAFPQWALVEGQTRSWVWTPPIRRLAASVDMLSPAPSPEHALLLAFPSTGRLPSTLSATDSSSVLFEAS